MVGNIESVDGYLKGEKKSCYEDNGTQSAGDRDSAEISDGLVLFTLDCSADSPESSYIVKFCCKHYEVRP